jgi:ABC-type transport system involved in cytochrome c biogenesis ATPase subunit
LVANAETEWQEEFAHLDGAQLEPTDPVLLDELLRESPAVRDSLVVACEELREIHAAALKSFQNDTSVCENPIIPPIINGLESFELHLEERVNSLKAENPNDEAAPLRLRLVALSAQQALAKHKPTLIEALRRKAISDHISTLQADLATRTVTEKQKALATAAIAGRYGETLKHELNALKVDRFQLGYKSTAAKGQVLQQLHFPDAPKVAKPEQVLSEGEHRVAALAAFLTEVNLRPIASGIILDDPVSSLDHRWVQRVARRLVEEAKKRQVIVFTHHLHFLFALRSAAEEQEVKVPFHPRTIQWGRNRPGVVIEGLPWRGRSVGERISILQKIIADARKHFEEDPTGEAFANDRSQFMNRLRATWERQVEEGLFNSVVTRFQEEVHTNQLRDVVVNDEDYQAISVGMTWASRQIEGHDHSIGVADVELTPEDMTEALGHLQRYRSALKERQKTVQDSRR